ncbi:hypothetical protein [Methylophaga sp.]|uniref:hypothetical protein n=1 Tax=Methylophaga sp. TaxID=2024840 RepID=UPI0025FB3CD2|nr:hypothetical protein [Methylophaga sp.]
MNLAVYGVAIGFTLGLAGGYTYRDNQAEAERLAAVETALEDAYREFEVSKKAEIELIEANKKTEIVYRTITKEIPKYVTQIQQTNSECNLTRGAGRLFNDAAAESLSRAAGIDDPADTGPSTITAGRLIDYSLEVIDQYNQAKNQCNALIDWHEKQKNEREK